jgi:site-specific recombinase XerD
MNKAQSLAEHSTYDFPLLASFERHLKAEGRRQSTLTHYLGATRQFLRFATDEGMPDATKVRREHIEHYLGYLYDYYPASASVLNRFKGLQAFFHWLKDEGEIRDNPMDNVKTPATDETRKDVVAQTDLIKAFKALEKQKRWRDCALIAVLYDTGIREGELAECRTENVNLDEGTIVLPRTKSRKMRTLPISPQTVRYIDRYWRQGRKDTEYLINGQRGRMTPSGLYHTVRDIFDGLGFKQKIGPHDLRHTAATHMAPEMSETALMSLFGWNTTAMVRHYTRQGQEKAAIEAHRRASPMTRLGKR